MAEARESQYDLLLKGGELVDPALGVRAIRDVAFSNGQVAAVEAHISPGSSDEVVDVTGRLVTPGLVDIHGHYLYRFFRSAAWADDACLPFGVTTTVDAGSSGWMHFDAFREFVISKQETRLYALVNLSILGMYGGDGDLGPTVGVSGGPQTLLPTDGIGELQDLRYAQVDKAVETIRENPNLVLGVKVRIDEVYSGEANAIPALERGRQVADITGGFMMVHVARSPIHLARIFEHMRPGDIVTHCFHNAENNVLDARGKVRPEVREAKAKGIVMDVGAVRTNFGIEVSRGAIEQGMLPDTLSTDRLRDKEGEPVNYSVPDLMSLYMGLGMTLEEAVAAATINGARAIGQADDLGTLAVGTTGDEAVLQIEDGNFTYDDGMGGEVTCSQRVNPIMTIKNGAEWVPRTSEV